MHVGVRRKERSRVSQTKSGPGREREAAPWVTSVEEVMIRKSRAREPGWGYLGTAASTIHHKSFLDTRNKVI